MKKEITELLAKHAKTDAKRLNIKDTVVQGFTLRIGRSGAKSFAMMMRDKSGRNRTYTVGGYPEFSVKEARAMAERIRHGVRYGGVSAPTRTGDEQRSSVTLGDLLDEAQPIFAASRKGWRPRGNPGSKSNMRSTIETVFAPLLSDPVEALTEEDIARAIRTYTPSRPIKGKTTANGQISRAMSYLAPVLDWAAHRGKFAKIGAGRLRRIDTPVLRLVYDPSSNDPTIKGFRTRVLSVGELTAVLPLLLYPAPEQLRRPRLLLPNDFGPVAMKFLFLTLARREEAATARWRDFDFRNGVWTKPTVKAMGGRDRAQSLPLSQAALALLRALPGYAHGLPDDYVFPNGRGGPLDNWDRISAAIYEASGTAGWTRHDVRRTGATLLEELGVAVQTVDEILAHTNRFRSASVSGSAGHYMVATRILNTTEDPKEAALNKLASAYDLIVLEASKAIAA
ncbi:integrase family protein [Pikeienuella sp. HZG-20]|uniref:tyrosine-type recombinase/integrase n=1 Tax=Paludibacillus litoralis TaxID=3133267 RepID=UPI0030EC1960